MILVEVSSAVFLVIWYNFYFSDICISVFTLCASFSSLEILEGVLKQDNSSITRNTYITEYGRFGNNLPSSTATTVLFGSLHHHSSRLSIQFFHLAKAFVPPETANHSDCSRWGPDKSWRKIHSACCCLRSTMPTTGLETDVRVGLVGEVHCSTHHQSVNAQHI